MAKFINTIDKLGDNAVMDSIIDGSIVEFMDDGAFNIFNTAFDGCTALRTINCPNAILYSPRSGALIGLLGYMTSLEYVKVGGIDLGNGAHMFRDCRNLRIADLGSVLKQGNLGWFALDNTDSLVALALRFDSVFYNDISNMNRNNIYKGICYVYVPRALIDSYKSATNWSAYPDQFRALEDYTVDGTVTGDLVIVLVSNSLSNVTTSNVETVAIRTYSTTLTAAKNHILQEVSITMGGVDVTSQVYNAATGEVNIPNVTGEIVITATAEKDPNIPNILAGVGFNSGYINGNTGAPASASSDRYTDYFDIGYLAGESVVVNLLDVKTTAGNSRIAYYDANKKWISCTNGNSKTSDGVSITSTVPATAVYAIISIAAGSGFSTIIIESSGSEFGYLEYTS